MKKLTGWLGSVTVASLMLCSVSFADGEIDALLNSGKVISGGNRIYDKSPESKIVVGSSDVFISEGDNTERHYSGNNPEFALIFETPNRSGDFRQTAKFARGQSAGETVNALIRDQYPGYNSDRLLSKILSRTLNKIVNLGDGGKFYVFKNTTEHDGSPGLVHIEIKSPLRVEIENAYSGLTSIMYRDMDVAYFFEDRIRNGIPYLDAVKEAVQIMGDKCAKSRENQMKAEGHASHEASEKLGCTLEEDLEKIKELEKTGNDPSTRGKGTTFAEALEDALGMKPGEIAAKQKFADIIENRRKDNQCAYGLVDMKNRFDADELKTIIQKSFGGNVCDDTNGQIVQLSVPYVVNRMSVDKPAPFEHLFGSNEATHQAGNAK